MDLKAIYDSQDDIPEGAITIENPRELFTERGGKFVLSGIDGVKTTLDTDALTVGVEKERAATKKAREELAALREAWGDLSAEEVRAKLDRIPELEAAAAGKLDDEKIAELANKRVEAAVSGKVAPLNRQVQALTKERDTLLEQVAGYQAADRARTIEKATTVAARASKVLPEAEEDVQLLASLHLEVAEDGAVVTKEGVKVGGKAIPAGLDAAAWLQEIADSRSHWWPASEGAGARGSKGGPKGGENPWGADHWNVTKQGEYLRQHGRAAADRMAKAAGSHVGATRPAKAAGAK